MIDHRNVKLGRLPSKPGLKLPELQTYLTKALPPPPEAELRALDPKIPWGMWGNDQIGDCTIAAKFNGIMLRSHIAQGKSPTVPAGLPQKIYFTLTGGEDSGLPMETALHYFCRTGVYLSDGLEKILYVQTRANPLGIKESVAFFGLADCGWNLPLSAQNQNVWDVVDPTLTGNSAPGSWGGHDAPIVGYDGSKGLYFIATWGGLQPASEQFVLTYMDQAFAVLSRDWLGSSGLSPDHIAWDRLDADLSEVRF